MSSQGLSAPGAKKSKTESKMSQSDLLLRRFREGISFPNFVERSILKLPLSELCAVPLPLQNRAPFEEEKRRKGAEKRRGRGVANEKGEMEKRTRENRSAIGGKAPDPPTFLAGFPCLFICFGFPFFCAFFAFFSKSFRGSTKRRKPCLFPYFFAKKLGVVETIVLENC